MHLKTPFCHWRVGAVHIRTHRSCVRLSFSASVSPTGAAEVRNVNFTRLWGAGVLHTKLWLVDGKHFYVGSANMDWRSLTQVPCD